MLWKNKANVKKRGSFYKDLAKIGTCEIFEIFEIFWIFRDF